MSEIEAIARRERAPDWVHDAVRGTVRELRLYARTLWGISVHPERFAREWADGTERALNPLAFLATSASFVASIGQVLVWLGLHQGDGSFVEEVLGSAGPFVLYGAAGGLSHVLLAATRPRRRLLDAVAIGLYAGGPALVGYVLLTSGIGAYWVHLGRPQALHGMLSSMSPEVAARWKVTSWIVVLLFVRSLWLGLAGLRDGRRIASGVATAFAMTVVALGLGALDMSGPFGLQPVLVHSETGWVLGTHD